MREELKQFDINLDNINENNKLFDNIQEAIRKMNLYTLKDRYEVILNNNLIECKEKLTNYRTIFGCRITYDDLPREISFVVKEDNKPSYEDLEQEIERLKKELEIEKDISDGMLETIDEAIEFIYENAYDSERQNCIDDLWGEIPKLLEILKKEENNESSDINRETN